MCVAAAIAGGAIGSSVIGGITSSDAASQQADAANNAAANSMAQYQQTRNDLAPYRDLGAAYIPQLNMAFSNFAQTPAFSFDASKLDQTPGYQFTLQQGLRAVQNSAASRGLGLSGAQEKQAMRYATGLADNTYQNQFNNALTTYNSNYGRAKNLVDTLSGLVGGGQSAATQTGTFGANATTAANNALMQGANASASGTMGTGNAISNGIGSVTNSLLTNQLLKSVGGSGLFG